MNPVVTAWLTQPGGVASKLGAMRRQANLSQTTLAEAIGEGWHQSKVSRIESGLQRPSEADVRLWAKACNAPDEADAILRLLESARLQHVGHRHRERQGLAAIQASYVDLVERASVICQFEVTFVPGLLQTADYARHVLTSLAALDPEGDPEGPEGIEQAVRVRVQRQQALYEPSKRFEFLFSESVLRLLLVPPDVMLAQLDRLQTVLGLPNVRMGVVPFGVLLSTAPQNKFELYDKVAIVESFLGDAVPDEDDAEAYRRILSRLWDEAIEGDEARQLLIRSADDLRRGGSRPFNVEG